MQPEPMADATLVPEGRAIDRHRGHDPRRRRPGVEAGGALGEEVALDQDPCRHVPQPHRRPVARARVGRPGGVEDDDAHAVIRDGVGRGLEAKDRAGARRRAVDCHGREHTRSDSRPGLGANAAPARPHEAMRRSSKARYRTDSCSHAASATIVAVRSTAASRRRSRRPQARRSQRPSRPGRRARRCSRVPAGRSARRAAGATRRPACPSPRTRRPWSDRLRSVNAVAPGRGEADVRGGDRGRDVVDRDAPVERDPIGDAEVARRAPGAPARSRRGRRARSGRPGRGGRSASGATARIATSTSYVGRQATGVDEAQRAVLAKARRGWAAGSKRASDGLLMTTDTLSVDTPRPTSRSRMASLTVSVAVENAIDSRSCESRRRWASGFDGLREAAPEELGHRLVQVEHDRHADEAERQGREHEEVRQRCDLDEGEPLAPVGPDRGPAGADEEREVLGEVRPQAGALVALDVEAADADAVQLAVGGLARAAQAEDEDRAAGGDERPRPRGGRAGPPRSSCGRSSGPAGAPAASRPAVAVTEPGPRPVPALRSVPTSRRPGAGPGAAAWTGRATCRRCRRRARLARRRAPSRSPRGRSRRR